MSLNAVTPTLPVNVDLVNQILGCRAVIYIAAGKFDTAEIPTNLTTLVALFSGGTPKFKPFGEQQEEGSQVSLEQEKFKGHKTEAHKLWNIKTSIKLITFNGDMLAFLDSAEYKGQISLLFVPEGMPLVAGEVSASNPAAFIALSGISLTNKTNLGTNGNQPTLEFTSETKGGKLSDIFKYKLITSGS